MSGRQHEVEQPSPSEHDFEWADEMTREHVERGPQADPDEDQIVGPENGQRGYR